MNSLSTTRKAILVIGMHRSGTSALTRGLEVLGINLGTRLRSPRTENPKGFWEDLDFNAINTDVLQAVGAEWHTPDRIEPTLLRSPHLEPLRSRATAFLEHKFATDELIGLKDPRASRILPFWQEIFERSGITAGYIIACRNPISVAKSLSTRDDFSTIQGNVLWLEYMLCSLMHSAHSSRVVVDYDNILANPEKELERIAKELEFSIHMDRTKLEEYSNHFLSSSLRSSSHTLDDLITCSSIPSVSKDTYLLIHKAASDAIRSNDIYFNNEVFKLDKIFLKDIEFLKNVIEEKNMLQNLTRSIEILEEKNEKLRKSVNSRDNKNTLQHVYFLLENILSKIEFEKTISSLRNKISRHLCSTRLILKNTKSVSSLISLGHELIGIIKKNILQRDKPGHSQHRNGSK